MRFTVLKAVLLRVAAISMGSASPSHAINAVALLTRVGPRELLELLGLHHRRPSDLDGALGGHRGHLGRSHAEGGCHCVGVSCVVRTKDGFDGEEMLELLDCVMRAWRRHGGGGVEQNNKQNSSKGRLKARMLNSAAHLLKMRFLIGTLVPDCIPVRRWFRRWRPCKTHFRICPK